MTSYANALAQYLIALLDDGEYQSDWLGHMPAAMAHAVHIFGRLTCLLMGL